MEYLRSEHGVVVTGITRNVKEGRVCNIGPSDAFLGIEYGRVQVVGIYDFDSLPDEQNIDVQNMLEYDHDVVESLWVAYKYVYSVPLEAVDRDHVYYFTLDLFLEHTTGLV